MNNIYNTRSRLFENVCNIVEEHLHTVHLIREDLTLSTKRAIVDNLNNHLKEMEKGLIFLDDKSLSEFVTLIVDKKFTTQEENKRKDENKINEYTSQVISLVQEGDKTKIGYFIEHLLRMSW